MKITDRAQGGPSLKKLRKIAEGSDDDVYTPRCPCEGEYCMDPSCDWPDGPIPGLGADAIVKKIDRPGYHMHPIERGELGELSKIQEELDEVKDAAWQGVRVMELVELSDMIGATRRYLERHHPGTTLDDLIRMSDVTRRAFENGHRREPE